MVNIENLMVEKVLNSNLLLEELDLYYDRELFVDLVIENLSNQEALYLIER